MNHEENINNGINNHLHNIHSNLLGKPSLEETQDQLVRSKLLL